MACRSAYPHSSDIVPMSEIPWTTVCMTCAVKGHESIQSGHWNPVNVCDIRLDNDNRVIPCLHCVRDGHCCKMIPLAQYWDYCTLTQMMRTRAPGIKKVRARLTAALHNPLPTPGKPATEMLYRDAQTEVLRPSVCIECAAGGHSDNYDCGIKVTKLGKVLPCFPCIDKKFACTPATDSVQDHDTVKLQDQVQAPDHITPESKDAACSAPVSVSSAPAISATANLYRGPDGDDVRARRRKFEEQIREADKQMEDALSKLYGKNSVITTITEGAVRKNILIDGEGKLRCIPTETDEGSSKSMQVPVDTPDAANNVAIGGPGQVGIESDDPPADLLVDATEDIVAPIFRDSDFSYTENEDTEIQYAETADVRHSLPTILEVDESLVPAVDMEGVQDHVTENAAQIHDVPGSDEISDKATLAIASVTVKEQKQYSTCYNKTSQAAFSKPEKLGIDETKYDSPSEAVLKAVSTHDKDAKSDGIDIDEEGFAVQKITGCKPDPGTTSKPISTERDINPMLETSSTNHDLTGSDMLSSRILEPCISNSTDTQDPEPKSTSSAVISQKEFDHSSEPEDDFVDLSTSNENNVYNTTEGEEEEFSDIGSDFDDKDEDGDYDHVSDKYIPKPESENDHEAQYQGIRLESAIMMQGIAMDLLDAKNIASEKKGGVEEVADTDAAKKVAEKKGAEKAAKKAAKKEVAGKRSDILDEDSSMEEEHHSEESEDQDFVVIDKSCY